MSTIGEGGRPIHTQREIRMYEEEYKEGAKLFQDAIQHYAKSDNPYQKKEFQEVMDKALSVLNECARELNRQALLEQNAKITKDYAMFNKSPGDEKSATQLEKDLEEAKNSIG